jgi:hypothetical protein
MIAEQVKIAQRNPRTANAVATLLQKEAGDKLAGLIAPASR